MHIDSCRVTAGRHGQHRLLAALTGLLMALCTDSWKGGSGQWSNAGKWSTGAVPGTSDNVCITKHGTYTVTLTGLVSVNSLTLGSTSGSQTLLVESNNKNGTAELEMSAPSTIRSDGTLNLDTTGTDGYGINLGRNTTITNDGTITTEGTAQINIQSDLTNDSGGTITVGNSDTTENLSTTPIDNNGSFTVTSTGAFILAGQTFTQTTGTLVNDGQFLVGSTSTFNQNGGTDSGNPIIVTSATLNDAAGAGSFALDGLTNLSGTIPSGQTVQVLSTASAAEATLVSPGVTNKGTLMLNAAGTGSVTLAGAPLTNKGTFSVLNSTSGTVSEDITCDLTNSAGATVSISNSDTTMTGNDTTTTNSGNFTIASPGSLASQDTFTQAAGTLDNEGSLSVSAATFNQNGGKQTGHAVLLTNTTLNDSAGHGSFTLEGLGAGLSGTVPSGQTVTVLGTTNDVEASLSSPGVTNDGTVVLDSTGSGFAELEGAPLTNAGTFTIGDSSSSTRELDTSVTNQAGATMSIASPAATEEDGSATVTNDGTLQLSTDAAQLSLENGSSLVDGATSQTALTIDGTQSSQITGGPVGAAGTLMVTTVAPSVGTTYTPITSTALTGTFSHLAFPDAAYNVAYSASAVTLTAQAPFKATGKNFTAVAGTKSKHEVASLSSLPAGGPSVPPSTGATAPRPPWGRLRSPERPAPSPAPTPTPRAARTPSPQPSPTATAPSRP